MNKLPMIDEHIDGLHQRYVVKKVVPNDGYFDDSDSKYKLVEPDPNAEYFVMRLDLGGSNIEHIRACRIGVHAYADAIEHHLPLLAQELRARYPVL